MITWPRLGFQGNFSEGENGWKSAMDKLVRDTALLVFTPIKGFKVSLPVSPSEGDSYVKTDGNLAVYANSGWITYSKMDGMEVIDTVTGKKYYYSASEGDWVDYATTFTFSTGALLDAIDEDPDSLFATTAEIKTGDVDRPIRPTEFRAAIDDLLTTVPSGSGAPSAAPGEATIPLYVQTGTSPHTIWVYNSGASQWKALNKAEDIEPVVQSVIAQKSLKDFKLIGFHQVLGLGVLSPGQSVYTITNSALGASYEGWKPMTSFSGSTANARNYDTNGGISTATSYGTAGAFKYTFPFDGYWRMFFNRTAVNPAQETNTNIDMRFTTIIDIASPTLGAAQWYLTDFIKKGSTATNYTEAMRAQSWTETLFLKAGDSITVGNLYEELSDVGGAPSTFSFTWFQGQVCIGAQLVGVP